MSPHTDPGALLKLAEDERAKLDRIFDDAYYAALNGKDPAPYKARRAGVDALVAAIRQAASHGREVGEREQIEAEARRYAEMYPQSSDGRNTFVIFADWVAALPNLTADRREATINECLSTFESSFSEYGSVNTALEAVRALRPKLTAAGEIKKANYAIAKWLSASLEDPAVCEAMKADINTWFEAHEPWPDAPLHCQCGACQRDQYPHASDCAVHNGPALPIGPCTCRSAAQAPLKLADKIHDACPHKINEPPNCALVKSRLECVCEHVHMHAIRADRLGAMLSTPMLDEIAEIWRLVHDERISAEAIGIRIRNTWPALEASPVPSAQPRCPNGLEHGNCGFPNCVSSCPGRLSLTSTNSGGAA